VVWHWRRVTSQIGHVFSTVWGRPPRREKRIVRNSEQPIASKAGRRPPLWGVRGGLWLPLPTRGQKLAGKVLRAGRGADSRVPLTQLSIRRAWRNSLPFRGGPMGLRLAPGRRQSELGTLATVHPPFASSAELCTLRGCPERTIMSANDLRKSCVFYQRAFLVDFRQGQGTTR